MKKVIKAFLLVLCLFALTTVSWAIEQNSSKRVVDKNYILRAIEKYSDKISTAPNDQDGYINRAYLNYLLGNYQEAIADYNVLISLNPNNEEFFLNRGYLKHLLRKREEALKDYDMALKIKPNYAYALNNKGVVLYELGRTDESMQSYNLAIKFAPDYADAYYNRGNLKTRTEKNKEALEDFNTAIKLNPADSASFNNRGVVKRKLSYNVGALSDFSIAIRLDPEDITAYANRGRLKKRYFDSEGAEEDFKTAISIAEENPTLVKEIQLEQEIAANQPKPVVVSATPDYVKYEKAPAELNKALRKSKVNPAEIQKISQKIAISDNDDNNVKSAVVKASVVKVTPSSNVVTTTSKQPVNVEPNITTKPVVNPELAECYYIRALQKYILQNRESAMKDFDMAIKHNPKYAEAYYYRAAIKRDFKQEGFVDDYKKAIELNPNLKTLAEADVLMILK